MLAAFVICLLSAGFGQKQVLAPSDKRIAYEGRWDRTNADAPTCQWTASSIGFDVSGESFTVTFDEKGTDFWEVVENGKPDPIQTLALSKGISTYTVNLPTGSVHTQIKLLKRTEPFVGTTAFLGASAQSFGRGERHRRHLEFVGDSITCGFGDEGANQSEPFKPATENGSLTYAALTAQKFNSDLTVIAWSGRKMWPDNTMPDIYDLVLPTDAKSIYDFKGPSPDAVVINLATNDFGKENPDESQWDAAYEAFIRRVWLHYPKARIYCVAGGMMSDDYPAGHHALSSLIGYLNDLVKTMNDPRVRLVVFDQQKMEDGIGAAWHPNLKTHRLMAEKLEEAIGADLGWDRK
jgi:lysophospholipase L1-like esterase